MLQPQPQHSPRRQPPSKIGDALNASDWPKRSGAPLRRSSATSTHGLVAPSSEALRPLARSLPRTAMARGLPADDRALCPSCHGTGAYGTGEDVTACPHCTANRTSAFAGEERGYCDTHQCKTCIGAGVVCPHCSGMRFVRQSRPAGNEAVRCPTCCEGNNVNATLEMFAIRAWLARRCPECAMVRPRDEQTCPACEVVTPLPPRFTGASRIWGPGSESDGAR